MNKETLEQIIAIIKDLKPFEKIEIKLEDNKAGRISFTRSSTHKTVIDLNA